MGFLAKEWDTPTIKRLFWVGVALTLGVFLLKFAVTGFGVFGDGLGYYTPLRSLGFDGNLRVDNEYRYYAETAVHFRGASRVPGPIPEFSKYTLGLGIVLLPFFLLGHGLALLLNQLGVPVEANGMTWPYELLYCLGSLSLGIGALVLAYRVACRYFRPTACAIAVGGIWFASPLTYYLCIEVSMSHAVSAFLIALAMWITLTKPWLTLPQWAISLGLTLGFAAWVRPQDILFFSVPVLVGWWGYEMPGQTPTPLTFAWQRSWQKLKNPQFLTAIALVLGATLLMQIPQILIYLWQYQGLTKIPYLEEGQARGFGGSFHWFQPALWQVLFSGHRGLFIWHPITFLSVVGLGTAWRFFPRISTSFLLAFSLQVYFIAAWWCWWQGASVGGRMFSNCTMIFVWGLAYLWQLFPSRRGRSWAVGITLFLIFWNALIIMQYQSAMIPPEDPVTFTQLYQNQFKVLPFFLEHLLKKFG